MNRILPGLVTLALAFGLFTMPTGAQLVDGDKPEPTPKAESKPGKSLTGEDPVGEAEKTGETQTVTKRAFVGVGLGMISRTQAQQLSLHPGVGLAVRSVSKDSAADKGGLEVGDVLHKMDDQILISHQQFAVLVSMKKPGEKVKLEYYHKGKPRKIELKLGEREVREANEARRVFPAPGGQGGFGPRGALGRENLTDEQRAQIEQGLEAARARLAERGIDLDELREGGATIRLGGAAEGGNVTRTQITDDEGNVIGETIIVESVEIEEDAGE